MHRNNILKTLQVLNINILLKTMSDDVAFVTVCELLRMAHESISILQGDFDYIWSEYGSGVLMEHNVEVHGNSRGGLEKLKIALAELLADEAKGYKGIPSLIDLDKPIDIKYLLFEMPSDIGIDFINEYLETIDFKIENLERNIEKDDNTINQLKELSETLTSIRDEQVRSEREWERKLEELEKEIEKERLEAIEVSTRVSSI